MIFSISALVTSMRAKINNGLNRKASAQRLTMSEESELEF
jgi:hypothetical protein